jgi:serine/threonine protein kinase
MSPSNAAHRAEHELSESPMSEGDAELDSVESLAEEFLERCRRGERPTIEEYTGRYPELAERIRDFLPALLMVERLKPSPDDPPGGGAVAIPGAAPERLGDYRILREVGRGGMGVVYEAEQISLGRRVALKVLPPGALAMPRQVERFRREARAAARLHHTNIVPVFGVGEEGGTYYYVMQFIEGRPLDDVLAELRRLRDEAAGRPAPRQGTAHDQSGAPAASDVSTGITDPPSTVLARALCNGRFRATSPNDSHRPDDPGSDDRPAEAGNPTPAVELASGGPSQTTSTGVLPDQQQPYVRSVAQIGIQVADALDYAADQGILHRDVKPSNLLLDVFGTVWLTDFGLAKASGAPDLTHTGDLFGTLRYLAPERFRGRSDIRSDVYALGLTLYELLALQPAFDELGQAELVRQITDCEPPRLSAIDPGLSRDLVTIVHKAMAKAPADRYPTPGALAEDLRRFLDDRPILARPLSLPERAWRWCRRNPAAAGLVAAVVALVGLVFGGGLWVQRQQLEVQGQQLELRLEAVLRRERVRGAIEQALEQQEDLRRRRLWEAARIALARAESRLDDADSPDLRRRLGQAQADLDYAIWTEADDPALVLRLAKAEAQSGRTERVETLLARVVAIQPAASETWKQRGLLLAELGQPDRAAADFARAVQLLPEDHFFDSPRSRLILELASYDRAFSKLLEARPGDHQLWMGRGRYHALCSRWRQAADDVARGIAAATPGTHEFYEYACLLLIVGDEERYRRLIQSLRRESGESKDPRLTYELARACTLAPEPVVDPGQVVKWARFAVESSPFAWHCHVLGAACYRAGDHAEAIRWLEDSLTRPWDPKGRVGRAQNQFVVAMAHFRLGHGAQSRARLDEAVRCCDELEASRIRGAVTYTAASDWLTIRLYRREAEALIVGRGNSADP